VRRDGAADRAQSATNACRGGERARRFDAHALMLVAAGPKSFASEARVGT
jgi:hypothetical protein